MWSYSAVLRGLCVNHVLLAALAKDATNRDEKCVFAICADDLCVVDMSQLQQHTQ